MRRRVVGLVRAGLLATLAAMAATTVAAALLEAVGVVFEVPDGGETIPLSGIAVVTGVFSVVGIVVAAALLRWSSRPSETFVRTTVALTALSLVPPWLVGAAPSTSVALVVLHLLAAALVIPSVAASLRATSSAAAGLSPA
jgi:Family of unknown function (DUF6069)